MNMNKENKGYKPNEEKIALAKQRREELKELSNKLRTESAEKGGHETLNVLLKNFYNEQNGTTDLRTFDQWKKAGYMVR